MHNLPAQQPLAKTRSAMLVIQYLCCILSALIMEKGSHDRSMTNQKGSDVKVCGIISKSLCFWLSELKCF